jgi:hypothetical protein
MLVIAIPWLTEKARETEPSPRRVRVFMAILLAFTITAYAVRSGNLFVYEPFCSRCRWGVPYTELAEKLREQGFRQGTIVVSDAHIGGNLRRFFPDSRIVISDPESVPTKPVAGDPGKVALVWPVAGDSTEMPAEMRNATADNMLTTLQEILVLPWENRWKPPGYRTSSWGTVIMERAKQQGKAD